MNQEEYFLLINSPDQLFFFLPHKQIWCFYIKNLRVAMKILINLGKIELPEHFYILTALLTVTYYLAPKQN